MICMPGQAVWVSGNAVIISIKNYKIESLELLLIPSEAKEIITERKERERKSLEFKRRKGSVNKKNAW